MSAGEGFMQAETRRRMRDITPEESDSLLRHGWVLSFDKELSPYGYFKKFAAGGKEVYARLYTLAFADVDMWIWSIYEHCATPVFVRDGHRRSIVNAAAAATQAARRFFRENKT